MAPVMLSEQVYAHLRDAIMRGEYAPGAALKPQDLAKERGVSLAVADARRAVEPVVLRMSIARGDLDWEARVRAAHHRLTRTPVYAPEEGEHHSSAWSDAHRAFHRTLLEGCGNAVLLETFDRMWTASELARRWSTRRNPDRDGFGEHRRLEEAALARDADTAAELLARHVATTAAVLADPEPARRSAAPGRPERKP